MSEAVVVLIAIGAGIGGGILLYWAVRAEGNRGETMSRVDAERASRRDTDGRDTDKRNTDGTRTRGTRAGDGRQERRR